MANEKLASQKLWSATDCVCLCVPYMVKLFERSGKIAHAAQYKMLISMKSKLDVNENIRNKAFETATATATTVYMQKKIIIEKSTKHTQSSLSW